MAKQKKDKLVVYSALEVANICGVVNQTAINWIKNGKIKAYKTPGGQFRVYPEDLVKFMKTRNMKISEELLSLCDENNEKKLLIVDDDEAFNNVIKTYLQEHLKNLTIIQAFDGFEAGTQMMEHFPECILLDLDLPGIDGVKLCHKIKESNTYGNPDIIIITALEDENLEKECLSLGVVDFIKKPVNLKNLSEIISKITL